MLNPYSPRPGLGGADSAAAITIAEGFRSRLLTRAGGVVATAGWRAACIGGVAGAAGGVLGVGFAVRDALGEEGDALGLGLGNGSSQLSRWAASR